MTPGDVWSLAAVAVCELVAAVFDAIQRALGRVTLRRAQVTVDAEQRGARAFAKLMRNPARALNTTGLVTIKDIREEIVGEAVICNLRDGERGTVGGLLVAREPLSSGRADA